MPHSHQQVAVSNNHCVGFVVMWIILDQAQLLEIAVHPEYRRQGIASALFNNMLDIARQQNCLSIELELRQNNFSP